MKVYLLISQEHYEEGIVLGVYSSSVLAIEAAKAAAEKSLCSYQIDEAPTECDPTRVYHLASGSHDFDVLERTVDPTPEST